MDEDDNDTEQMKNIINVSKSLGFLCLVNGLVMFGDAVNTIKVGLGQEFSLHLSFGNQRIFKEPVGVFNLIALVRNLIFKETSYYHTTIPSIWPSNKSWHFRSPP